MKRFISLLLVAVMLVSLLPSTSILAANNEIASVSVTADKWCMLPGETAQLSAKALNADGDVISNAEFSFQSMDESIVSVDSNGLATAVGYGVMEVLVKATVNGVTIPKLVKLTAADPSDRETFDDLAPGSVPTNKISGVAMAEVSDEVGKNSAMSVKLNDTSTTSAAMMRYETLQTKEMVLEFDAYTKSTGVHFRLSNGGRGNANTAFWLRINTNQVQYYDGKQVKWTNLPTSYNSIANTWASIRVEAKVDDVAKVYVNGQYIGDVPRTSGEYGANATASMDSVVFEAGDAATIGSMYYIDNLKLYSPLGKNGETFDKLDLNGTPEKVDGYIDHNAAVIKTAPGSAGNKTLMLMGSKENTAAPNFNYMFETAEKLTMEFDVYIPEAANILSFQLYNGTKAYDNTLFFFQFNHVYGLRVYDGAWKNINADAKLMAKQWNKVRMEITAGQNAVAKVYLNGELVATTSVAFYKKDSINGINFMMGTKEQTCYLDNLQFNSVMTQSFDDLEQAATPDEIEGCTGYNGATIKADPVNAGGQSLHLIDPTGTKIPAFLYKFPETNAVNVDFKVYIPSQNNSVTFQLYSGSKSYGSSAFWMQFNHAYGLRAYADNAEGKSVWQPAVNSNAKLKAGVWNTVRLEVTTGANSQAKVFLNGVEVGTITTPCRILETVNGFTVSPGSATTSCYVDDLRIECAVLPEAPEEPDTPVNPDQPPMAEIEGAFTFEELEVGTDLSAIFASGTTMATVSGDKAATGSQSAYLADTSTSSAALLRVQTDKSAALELDFDFYPVVGALNLRLTNGGRSDANTAFFFQFSNRVGGDGVQHTYLRYYDGTAWMDVYEFPGSLANKWSRVHVEAAVDGVAKVYVNDAYVGLATRAAGNYGKNVSTEIDSVIFECGDSGSTNCKAYLDNLKLVAATVADGGEEEEKPENAPEGFESMSVGTDLAAIFASGTTMATVSGDKSYNGSHSAYLADTSTSSAAILRVQTDKSAVLELDFAYHPVVGGLNLRISNGARSDGNTAFFIQFINRAVSGQQITVLRYYSGSAWVDLYEFESTLANKWTAIHVEAAVDGTAQVWADGNLIGEAPRAAGNYGKNVSTEIDSVIFECGDSGSTTGKLYLDDVLLTPPTEDEGEEVPEIAPEGFESLKVGDDLAAIFASGTTMATVSDAKSFNGGKSAYLADTSTSSAALLRVQTDKANAMTLEFAYHPVVGGLNLRISNGGRSDGNTAFFIQFINRAVSGQQTTVLRYYSGSAWVDVYTFANTLANKWTRIRVEAAVDGVVKVWADGELIGEAPRAGGNYGKNVSTVIDSAIFECGDSGSTTGKLYLDDILLTAVIEQPAQRKPVRTGDKTPEEVETVIFAEDFENVETQASVQLTPNYVGDNGASIQADPADAANEVVYLADANGQNIPYLDYAIGEHSKVTLEFEVYNPAAENDVTVQIYSGSKANAAFWLEFHNQEGLRVNNGEWSVVNADAKLAAQKWNKIRLELTTGENAQVKIYLGGKLMGTTKLALNKTDMVNGIYIATGAGQSLYLDDLKISSTTSQNFNSLAVNETPDKLPGYVAHVRAAIKADPGVDKTVYLYDSTGETTPYFSYVYGYYSQLKLEFEVYLPTSGNDLSFRIFNGSSADVYTAYLLEFSKDGLRVNNGEWSVVNADAKLSAKKWHKICVEWNAETGKADIYLNGKLVGATELAMNRLLTVNGLYVSTNTSAYLNNVKASGTEAANLDGNASDLLTVELGGIFDITDNTEKEGLPEDDPIIKEDFRASFGQYGFSQIPHIYCDTETGLVYVNYARHRDTVVDHPYDSTRVYDVQTMLNAAEGDQLQKEYVDMITENTMFFGDMVKLSDGRIFCQNYPTYYLTDTTSTTYSWIVNTDGSWEKVEGVLTLPAEMCYEGPQPTTTWARYGFTRCLVELDDGTLLGAMYGSYGTIMVETKDYGKTWTYRSTIADSALGLDQPYINTDGTDITWFEPGVTRCADGSLLCVMRTYRNKPLYQVRSYDNGLTWTEPTLMPGMEGKSILPKLVLLSNGVLAMGTGVPGDTIYFSLDGCGYNWDYCVTTYSADTTGNSSITEVAYDEATGTVTLVAVGDKGFNNRILSGVWGRVVTVTRNHVEDPKLAKAVIQAEEDRTAPGETVQMSVNSLVDSDANIISDGYDIEWYSLTPLVASVDANGQVTGKTVGTAKIQAVVSYNGKTVMSNEFVIEVRDRDVIDYLEITPTAWVLKPGQSGSLTSEAFNYFGQEFVSKIKRVEYINGNVNEPKYIVGDVQWSFASTDPECLEVDPVTGDYRALKWGCVDLQATAVKDGVTLVKNVTVLIESEQWVMEDFEGGDMPEGVIHTDCVSISNAWSWSGNYALYLNDDDSTLLPTIRYPLPESRGLIVEFMMFTESVEHTLAFGVGSPNENGGYNYLANVCYIGLLNNPHTAAQGFQAFNGVNWGYSNRANNIPHRKWDKIRIEVTTDGYRFYANGKLLREQDAAAKKEILDTLFFSGGGTAYTGDSMYIDDIRYMVFDETEPAISMTEQELVHDGDKFYIENTFYFTDIEGVDVTTDAGLLIWTSVQFAGRKIEYDEVFARPGLTDIGGGYYTAKSDVIESGNLAEGFYYCGYVKLADGTYIYSEALQYAPSSAELNFIAAAQSFLLNGIGKSKLANAKLTNAQKELQWINLGRQLGIKKDLLNKNLSDEQKQDNWNKSVGYMNLAPEVTADKQVEKDAKVFNNTGKTFQIGDKISLCAVYEINGNTIANAKQYGTIFWTAEQFEALQGAPSISNYGEGLDVKMQKHGESGNVWVSVGMQLELEEMANGEYYMLGYVVDANGNVSYSGVMSYTVEQYVKNMVESEYTTPEMAELAKRLFAYERQEMKD